MNLLFILQLFLKLFNNLGPHLASPYSQLIKGGTYKVLVSSGLIINFSLLLQ